MMASTTVMPFAIGHGARLGRLADDADSAAPGAPMKPRTMMVTLGSIT